MKKRVVSILLSLSMLCTACGVAGNSAQEQPGEKAQDQAAQEVSESASGADDQAK